MSLEAAKAAQAILRQLIDPTLGVDGHWGTHTQGVYMRARPDVRAAVDAALRDGFKTSSAELAKATTAAAGLSKNTRTLSSSIGKGRSSRWGDADRTVKAALEAAIRNEAIALGIPPRTALTIAQIESGFNPTAMSPTGAVGPFQVTSIAQKDVAQRGGYSGDRYVVEDNIKIGLRYMRVVARDMNVGLDEVDKIYMGFNIGPSGARAVLAGVPEKAAAQIRLQAFGPPAVYATNLRAKVAASAFA